MNENALMVQNNRLAIMPVMDNTTAMMRRQAVIDFTRSVMKPDVDYGRVPGTNKDTLLKPGAEKLTSLFGLSPRFSIVEKATDWTGKEHGNEPFFYFQYRCSLFYGDVLAGEGVGSCNSWEKKYRYRNAERVCPDCGKATLFKSKPRPGDQPNRPMGYYCWNKKGGCGAQFPAGDTRIESQEAGQVLNDNPADLVNTVDKMAQKRALVAAVLIAVNASEFFTQDIEDMDFGPDMIDVTPTVKQKPAAQPATNGHTNGNGHKSVPVVQTTVTPEELFPEAASPEQIAVWRERLAKNLRPTVSTVCSTVVGTKMYVGEVHAFNAFKLAFPDMEHNSSTRLTPADALVIFDKLVARKMEPEDVRDPHDDWHDGHPLNHGDK